MLFSIIFYIILSVTFIFFIHQLYEYFKNLYTVKRTKDVYKLYDKKYDKIVQDQATENFKKKQTVVDSIDVNSDIIPKHRSKNPFVENHENVSGSSYKNDFIADLKNDAILVDELSNFVKSL